MMIVALIGVLGVIGFNQYSNLTVRARKGEAKTSLAKVYASEKAFFVEFFTYTSCLRRINALSLTVGRYYWVGFNTTNSNNTCSMDGNQGCNHQRFATSRMQPTDPLPPPSDPCDCVVTAPAGPPGSNLGEATDCAALATESLGAPIDFSGLSFAPSRIQFLAGAVGRIKRNGPQDVWTIDHNKAIRNPNQGD